MGQLRFLLVPLAIIAFNFLFMGTMRTVLITITYSGIADAKLYAAFVALVVATVILVGAAYLSRRGPSSPRAMEHSEHH
jgi:hypothetical protein